VLGETGERRNLPSIKGLLNNLADDQHNYVLACSAYSFICQPFIWTTKTDLFTSQVGKSSLMHVQMFL
jgi:hypothetical protein